jgi:hypothetical protein
MSNKDTSINAMSSSTTAPMQTPQEQYISTLSEKEYQGYLIARSHLGSSFDLEKSLGFIEWKKTAQSQQPSTPSPASSAPYNP